MPRAIWAVVTLLLMIASFTAGRTTSGIQSLPAIAATLPGDEREFSHELDEKIRELFPVGSSEKQLISYLANNGFVPEWRERDEVNASIFVHAGIICKKTLHVYWRADSAGILTQIDAAYESQCI